MRYFDLHCDTIAACADRDLPLAENDLHVSLAKAAGIERYVQCFAVFVHDRLRGEEAVSYFSRVADRFDLEMERNAAAISPCRTGADLSALSESGKHGGILTVESAAALGGDLSHLEDWRRRGVRMCTLTWNGANELGRGVMAPGKTGLSAFGRRAVPALEIAGIILDLSHASPELFWEVAGLATAPLAASHSNAKSVCGHPRNLTDEQFLAIRDSGGLVGLNFYQAFLHDEPDRACMDDVLRHAEHFLALGGEGALALGGDLDGSALPEDMADGLSAIPRLYEHFLRHYPQALTDRIFFDNAARFFGA